MCKWLKCKRNSFQKVKESPQHNLRHVCIGVIQIGSFDENEGSIYRREKWLFLISSTHHSQK